ncbi:MAG: ABC transporter ATP-binding protein [Bacillota bacterium]|nr:ABC transporter ATP-binding protein [Bacillota bacterium]
MLDVKNLCVDILLDDIPYPVLENVSLTVDRGETLGLVGESGCGKSMTAMAIMGLLRSNIKISGGAIDFNGADLAKYTAKDYYALRGKQMSMIFQDSMSSLNPLMKVGKQIREAYQLHYDLSRDELEKKCVEALENVGFVDPQATLKKYPHQLSGGQRQRVMIAIAISAHPELLIADEPTTALDVTTQNKILTLMKQIQALNHMSIIIISHDITVISQTCSHVGVMYCGWMVEYGKTEDIIKDPRHPYTRALINSIPNAAVKDKPLTIIDGRVPSLKERPKAGCVFYDRCQERREACKGEIPVAELAGGRRVKCVLFEGGESHG